MVSDPIADLLTRIRNAQAVNKETVRIPYSKQKEAVIKILVDHDYLGKYEISDKNKFPKEITINLRYFSRHPVINKLQKISKPGMRIYADKRNLHNLKRGRGITIISTSKGIITVVQAKKQGLGGEIICKVS